MRSRITLALLSLPLLGLLLTAAQADSSSPAPFYQSLAEIQAELQSGQITSVQLTQDFLQRIHELDPKLHAVIELNPDALSIAAARDADRKAGKANGALFGVPFLVKDNLDSGDKMMTTAGSLALAGPPASQDATVLAKLRAAGAVLIGKTNLSEWANIRSTHATSGWSGRGGLVHNPYVLDRNACGSSSGSGAAEAAGFATLAVGTETDGSLTCPSSINGLVTIKPTLGLLSRAGIVPISHSQDGPGPMTRSVADAVAMLTAMAGSDPRDPMTAEADQHKTDYSQYLKTGSLQGKHIGVVCELAGFDPNVDRILNRSAAALRAAGATVEPVLKFPHFQDYGKDEQIVLSYELKHDLNVYLATRKGLKVKTLDDVIAFDDAHAAEEMPWFGQELFLQASPRGPLTDKKYTDALAEEKRFMGPEGIDAVLHDQKLDALMAPAAGPAWITDLVYGDGNVGGGDSPAAVAGYPSITVPAGNDHGLPVGVVFFAGKWSEPALIGMAYDFEQKTQARIEPQFLSDAPVAVEVASLAQTEGRMPAYGADAPAVCPAAPVP